jgi:hypothetical protein
MVRSEGYGRGRTARLVGAAAVAIALVMLGGALSLGAEGAIDPSDVVVALDYSASILDDKPVRTKFADALDDIADHVDANKDDFVKRDITMSFVPFGTRARSLPGCERLSLQGDAQAVLTLADCLRKAVGKDTNYVAALKQAAKDLPANAKRPALVLFTDGKHDVAGVPASAVLPTAERLFADRPAFALLPVGMGLASTTRKELQGRLKGLAELTHNIASCDGSQQFSWPRVVFNSPLDAGHAVATALNEVTCAAFTSETTTPTPTPAVAPGSPSDVQVAPGNGSVRVTWSDPNTLGTAPLRGFQARCRAADVQEWLATQDVSSTEHTAVFAGLENGTEYACEVAASSEAGAGAWAEAGAGTPAGPPGAPAGIEAQGGDASAILKVSPGDDGGSPITDYRYECTTDGGVTWSLAADPVSGEPLARLQDFANGTEYACRASAANAKGASDPSPASNVFRPCSGLIECNPALKWMLPLLALVVSALIAWLLLAWRRERLRKHINAYVDEAGTITLGRGPRVGLAFVGDDAHPGGANADVPIRYRGSNEFDVTSGGRTTRVRAGDQFEVVDREGESHSVVLRASGTRTRESTPTNDEEDWSASAPVTTSGGRPAPPTDDWD